MSLALFNSYHFLQLLRLKCEAYSTLNDSDEDFNAENRLSERMRDMGCLVPPPAALVAPAALYLTAVIECVYLASKLETRKLT